MRWTADLTPATPARRPLGPWLHQGVICGRVGRSCAKGLPWGSGVDHDPVPSSECPLSKSQRCCKVAFQTGLSTWFGAKC